MGDDRTDFDHAIPMSDVTSTQQDADLAGENGTALKVDANAPGTSEEARQTLREGAGKVGQQASEKVRALAEQGKDRAGGALDQLSQMLTDAATQVDDKLGDQYGQYARQAATSVQGFSDQIRTKSVDELLDDARGLVRKSPAVAIGAAAAVGFVLARLIQAGVDEQKGDRA